MGIKYKILILQYFLVFLVFKSWGFMRYCSRFERIIVFLQKVLGTTPEKFIFPRKLKLLSWLFWFGAKRLKKYSTRISEIIFIFSKYYTPHIWIWQYFLFYLPFKSWGFMRYGSRFERIIVFLQKALGTTPQKFFFSFKKVKIFCFGAKRFKTWSCLWQSGRGAIPQCSTDLKSHNSRWKEAELVHTNTMEQNREILVCAAEKYNRTKARNTRLPPFPAGRSITRQW